MVYHCKKLVNIPFLHKYGVDGFSYIEKRNNHKHILLPRRLSYNDVDMLRLGSTLTNLTVMSLQVGYPVATATTPIINPHNLTIAGFLCNTPDVPAPAVLMAQDIREISGKRIVIDNADEIRPAEDLIRLKDILLINYEIPGKKIMTESKRTLGKAEDYIVNDADLMINKIHVAKSSLLGIAGGKLIIDRQQVVATYDKKIVVKDGTEKIGVAKPTLARSTAPTTG
jgi:uncharacterized protein YrrD